MRGVEEDGAFPRSFGSGRGLDDLGIRGSDKRFDASQYEFFGQRIVDEIELGGLEDDAEGNFSCSGDIQEGEADDLNNTYTKLNTVLSGSKGGIIADRGLVSRENFSLPDWSQDETDLSNWLDQQHLSETEIVQANQWRLKSDPSVTGNVESNSIYRTSSNPLKQSLQHESVPGSNLSDPRLLYRTSSYPQQPLQQSTSTGPILIPKEPCSYPPLGVRSQFSPNFPQNLNSPSMSPGVHMSLSPTNLPSFPASQLHMPGVSRGLPYAPNMPPFTPPGPSNSRTPNLLMNASSFMGGHLVQPGARQQLLPHPDGRIPPASFLQQQQHQQILHRGQHSLSHAPRFPPHQLYSFQEMSKFDAFSGVAELRDNRSQLLHKGKQIMRSSQHGIDTGGGRSGWPQFRSRYMTPDEIEGVLRTQHSATHSNDPYLEDYYHQACLAKKSAGLGLKHHFFPQYMKDMPSRGRPNGDQHAYLQVDALGRLAFSSIRRPRPLLEVDIPSTSADSGFHEHKSPSKPLDQEPMLSARIAIEDCVCLLLDVDDINRLLEFGHSQDSVSELRARKQVLLEGLASSLQLVDPLGPGKADHSTGPSTKDDLVFLRIVSLPKGCKLLSRYLKLLSPADDLARIACMAVFRHLRFIFGVLPSDGGAVETTTSLASTVSSCVSNMDLNALSACLAAVVCSSDPPPLRPIGSTAGDGASVVIKSVLVRATSLLTNSQERSHYNVSNRVLWQASFDAFFILLMKYCLSKYEGVMQLLYAQTPNQAVAGPAASGLMGKEMPVDLLRMSLPHTNEQQRQALLDFAQKSVPVYIFNAQ